jgi:hypothetical protein
VWKFLTGVEFVTQCAPGIMEKDVVFPYEKYFAFASVGF